MDPDNFESPKEFRPERWLEAVKDYDPFAYIPFSAGPRNCLGQHLAMIEMKVMIVTFLRNLKPVLRPGKTLRRIQLITYQPEDEYLVDFVRVETSLY